MGPGPELRQEDSKEDEEVEVGDKHRQPTLLLLAAAEADHEEEEAGNEEDCGRNED